MKLVWGGMQKKIREALERYACMIICGGNSEIVEHYKSLRRMCDSDFYEELDDISVDAEKLRARTNVLVEKIERNCA